jgi:hypothetical protein
MEKDTAHPGWYEFRDAGGMFCAWWPEVPRSAPGPDGLLVLRDVSEDRLRDRVDVFMAVWDETHSRAAAEEAAQSLES